jgi:c-di-GMP-binding flagellar brake protein YcgR
MNFEKQPTSSPMVVPQDRRAHPRITLQVQVELRKQGEDVPFRLETTDLSKGGCYIQMMMTMPVSTNVNMTLWINDSPVRVRARVVTCHPQFGNGIMFLEFQGDGKQLLERYLDAMDV